MSAGKVNWGCLGLIVAVLVVDLLIVIGIIELAGWR